MPFQGSQRGLFKKDEKNEEKNQKYRATYFKVLQV